MKWDCVLFGSVSHLVTEHSNRITEIIFLENPLDTKFSTFELLSTVLTKQGLFKSFRIFLQPQTLFNSVIILLCH